MNRHEQVALRRAYERQVEIERIRRIQEAWGDDDSRRDAENYILQKRGKEMKPNKKASGMSADIQVEQVENGFLITVTDVNDKVVRGVALDQAGIIAFIKKQLKEQAK